MQNEYLSSKFLEREMSYQFVMNKAHMAWEPEAIEHRTRVLLRSLLLSARLANCSVATGRRFISRGETARRSPFFICPRRLVYNNALGASFVSPRGIDRLRRLLVSRAPEKLIRPRCCWCACWPTFDGTLIALPDDIPRT